MKQSRSRQAPSTMAEDDQTPLPAPAQAAAPVVAPQILPISGREMIAAPADRSPAEVYLARLGAGSRRAMAQALHRAAAVLADGKFDARTMPWAAVRYQHVQFIRAKLAEELAPQSVNKILSAVKGTLREAWRLGQISAEEYQRVADVESVKGSRLPAGRALSEGEIRALFQAMLKDDNKALAIRDAALVAVLYACGLRRSEVVKLNLKDFDPESATLKILSAKGSKDRLVYATNGAKDAILDWITVRGPEEGPLFLAIRKDGAVLPRRLTVAAVYKALQVRAEQAGIAAFSPHSLRRTCVSDLLDAGADVGSVQKLLGHANVSTTLKYDRRPEAAKQKAASLLFVPYKPRK